MTTIPIESYQLVEIQRIQRELLLRRFIRLEIIGILRKLDLMLKQKKFIHLLIVLVIKLLLKM